MLNSNTFEELITAINTLQSQVNVLESQRDESYLEQMGPVIEIWDDPLFIDQLRKICREHHLENVIDPDVLIYTILNTIKNANPLEQWYRPSRRYVYGPKYRDLDTEYASKRIALPNTSSTYALPRMYYPMPKFAVELVTNHVAYKSDKPLLGQLVKYVCWNDIARIYYDHFSRFYPNGYDVDNVLEADFTLLRVLMTVICDRIILDIVDRNKLCTNPESGPIYLQYCVNDGIEFTNTMYQYSAHIKPHSITWHLLHVIGLDDSFAKSEFETQHEVMTKMMPLLNMMCSALTRQSSIINKWCEKPETFEDKAVSTVGLDLTEIQAKYVFW